MKKISLLDGAVSYRATGAVVSAAYSGPMNLSLLNRLRDTVVARTPQARAYLICFSAAMLSLRADDLMPAQSEFSSLADGVIVCRDDQLQLARSYSQMMADRGVIRVVFSQQNQGHAASYAAMLAARNRISLRSQS